MLQILQIPLVLLALEEQTTNFIRTEAIKNSDRILEMVGPQSLLLFSKPPGIDPVKIDFVIVIGTDVFRNSAKILYQKRGAWLSCFDKYDDWPMTSKIQALQHLVFMPLHINLEKSNGTPLGQMLLKDGIQSLHFDPSLLHGMETMSASTIYM